MKALGTLFLASAALLRAGRSRPRQAGGAAHRHVADLQWRLLRPALQHARQNQPVEYQFAVPGVGLPRQRSARRRRRSAAASRLDPCPGERGPLLHHAGPRLGGGCAHRTRSVALPVDLPGRRPHRQPRRRRVRQLAVLRDARLPPGVAQPERRQGALAHADLRSGSVLLRLDGAAGGQEPHHHRRQRRRSGPPRLHRIPRPRNRRSAMALVHRARRRWATRARKAGRAKRP